MSWLGMNEIDAFYHEANIHLHIEMKRQHCTLGSNNVVKLLNIDPVHYSITTEYQGKVLTNDQNIEPWWINSTLQNISSFMTCAGIVHCDVVSKNFAVTKSKQLYIFDMDMAYIINNKPKHLKCTDTLDKALYKFPYVGH